ncbi:aardvark [Tieghemostelium lacteum]|uniref:Aardvark n=1 Tax=Tieghemostelium lacteum TaxID=361077 RepID=A0A151ZAS0_TIELA|nr:aardvark [Tieghemostelium lacteum]|eukprot:KYQ91052.1 aardvark [Tieghemostelium lacteum]
MLNYESILNKLFKVTPFNKSSKSSTNLNNNNNNNLNNNNNISYININRIPIISQDYTNYCRNCTPETLELFFGRNIKEEEDNSSILSEEEELQQQEVENLPDLNNSHPQIQITFTMSTKSISNYSSPNTLIPSVSKTFISQFNLSILSPPDSTTQQQQQLLNQQKYYNNQLIQNSNNSMKVSSNKIYNSIGTNSQAVENTQFDIFSIPTEMLVHLLGFLSAKDLWRISLTCKRIWYMIDVFKFWELLFEKTCPRIYFAMQFNSRWTSPTPHQAKMILCYIDSLPQEYYQNFDPNDENGQIKKVIGVMKEHLQYPSILRETCYVLKRLSYRQRKEDEHESLIARYGGIKLILQTMKTHPYDSGVQEDACGALGNLTCDSPNNLGVYSNNNYLEVVEQGGIQLILQAMKNHLYNPGVQYNTSFVLRNLARNDVSESRVAQEGGIQAIATAMRNHPNHIGIQTQGCGALRNLGCNDSNKILSAREGGISLILKAMKIFSSHPDLQLNGCGALRNLARNEDNKNMISKQGGIQLVLQAMTNHQDDPDVQDEGCAALINLAYQDETNEETIAQEGGVNLILKAMKNHPFHSGVQMQGRGALKNLSCNPKNKLVIARSGGIELMNIAIQNHPSYANRFSELMRILQAALDN